MLLRRTFIVFMVALLLGALALTSCAPKLQPEPAWERDARTAFGPGRGLLCQKTI